VSASPIEVSEWLSPPRIGSGRPLVVSARPGAAARRAHLLSAALVLLGHGLILAALWSTLAAIELPEERERRAGSRGGGSLPVTTLFFSAEPPEGEAGVAPPVASAIETTFRAPPALELPAPKLDLLELTEEAGWNEHAAAPVAEGGEDRERLRAIYTGQLEGRVARVWQAALAERSGALSTSECEVRVRQDPSGVVLEVSVGRCGADERWRAALLAAIRRAAPLPAPPSAELFSEVVYFTLRASGEELVTAMLPTIE
jgi:hypothetical protein